MLWMRWQASFLEPLVNRLWSSGSVNSWSSPSVSATHWRSTSKRDSKTKLWFFSFIGRKMGGLELVKMKAFLTESFLETGLWRNMSLFPDSCCNRYSFLHCGPFIPYNLDIIHCSVTLQSFLTLTHSLCWAFLENSHSIWSAYHIHEIPTLEFLLKLLNLAHNF